MPEGAEPFSSTLILISHSGEFTGGTGPEVLIFDHLSKCLELIPGARAERQNGEVTLWLLRKEEADRVWQTAVDMLSGSDVVLKFVSNLQTLIETGWVTWVSEDEET